MHIPIPRAEQNKMMQYDVTIIGGGAAGLTAALSASGKGKRVLILEAASRAGRKLLATGNGRCNLLNMGAPRYPGGEGLALAALRQYPAARVRAFFEGLGLATCQEEGGRVYPACGQAAAVLDVLRGAAEERGVELRCDARTTALEKTNRGFRLTTPQGALESKTVVAACGGMAGENLGHDGAAYALFTGLGHSLRAPRPALAPLTTEKSAVRGLKGLRLPALLTLCDGELPVEAAQGEALFTDYGVSGVCAMQLSRKAGELLGKKRRPVLYLDFSPMIGLIPRVYDRAPAQAPGGNFQAMEAYLRQRAHTLRPENLLRGLTPRLLSQRLEGLSIAETARMLCAFPAPVTGVRGMGQAQVTRGGLKCEEFDPADFASRLVPGLFAAGEVLDVDGDCGGYNLLFAFASGLIAGKAAARRAAGI